VDDSDLGVDECFEDFEGDDEGGFEGFSGSEEEDVRELLSGEEVGDFYIREVWKTVSFEPTGDPNLRKTVPIFEDEAKQLLGEPDDLLVESLYRKLGVTNRDPLIGLPKGPYYDAVDTVAIREGLRRALKSHNILADQNGEK